MGRGGPCVRMCLRWSRFVHVCVRSCVCLCVGVCACVPALHECVRAHVYVCAYVCVCMKVSSPVEKIFVVIAMSPLC